VRFRTLPLISLISHTHSTPSYPPLAMTVGSASVAGSPAAVKGGTRTHVIARIADWCNVTYCEGRISTGGRGHISEKSGLSETERARWGILWPSECRSDVIDSDGACVPSDINTADVAEQHKYTDRLCNPRPRCRYSPNPGSSTSRPSSRHAQPDLTDALANRCRSIYAY
jgi:hypothetical protein